jgi:signal transduction histidine kinase/ligand-binding sensor domain-containing protein/DNA-binding response OmpR family regulator
MDAQPYSYDVRIYQNKDGLSQATANSIIQDRKGFIWIGTENGLNRFDGHEFVVYNQQPFDTNSLADHWTNCILEDREGFLWVGTESNGLDRFDPETEDIVHISYDSTRTKGVCGKKIKALLEDPEGKIWIATDEGLCMLSADRKTISYYPEDFTGGEEGFTQPIFDICLDPDGFLWIRTDDGIFRLDRSKGKVDARFPTAGIEVGNSACKLVSDSKGRIWTLSREGLFVLQKAKSGFASVKLDAPDNGHLLFQSRKGSVWLGCDDGKVWNILAPEGEIRAAENVRFVPLVSGHTVGFPKSQRSIFETKEAVLFMSGNQGEGLWQYIPSKQPFSSFQSPHHPEEMYLSFLETEGSLLFIGSRDIQLIQTTANYFHELKWDVMKPGTQFSEIYSGEGFHSIVEDMEGRIWLASSPSVLYCLKDHQGEVKVHLYTHQPGDPKSLPNARIRKLFYDRDGRLWIGTNEGLILAKETATQNGWPVLQYEWITHDPRLPAESLVSMPVRIIFQDHAGDIWAGTQGGGLSRIRETPTGKYQFKNYVYQKEDAHSISSNTILGIVETEPGVLWIATAGGGLNQLDVESGHFSHFTQKDGLPSDVVYALEKDERGRLWMSFGAGIGRLDPKTMKFRHFTEKDGVREIEGCGTCGYRASTGEIFFGGSGGFTVFHPDSIRENTRPPTVVLTGFQLFNEDVPVWKAADSTTWNSPLKVNIAYAKEIRLRHSDQVFTLEFAALDFGDPGNHTFTFKLEGFDHEWTQTDESRPFVTYRNLPPGKYDFRLNGKNADGYSDAEGLSLQILIAPPWYKTWWAICLYALIFAGLLFGAIRFAFVRQKLKTRIRIRELEARQLKELDETRSRFFANISHEFRTPLTLILGPLEDKMGDPALGEDDKKLFSLMRRNAKSLLSLIEQLLDLSKLRAMKMEIHAAPGDLFMHVRAMASTFESKAKQLGVDFHPLIPATNFPALFDRDMLEKIVNNLLGNAFKFTAEGGRVSFRATIDPDIGREEDIILLCLEVEDTGKGIPEAKIDSIFDPFFQVDGAKNRMQEGSGIGLALTKELVDLLGGTIEVRSREGEGSLFSLRIPLQPLDSLPVPEPELAQTITDPARVIPENGIPDTNRIAPEGAFLLLIVEDNPDLRFYLVSHFQPEYRVIEAANGQEGWELAQNAQPDLILSDVMMPRMDGIELCSRIKEDMETSHIPIILLTARADHESRVEGLETGADAYLAKPFNRDELKLMVRNLIRQRQAVKEKFRQESILPPAEAMLSPYDRKFMEKAVGIMEEEIGNPAFKVPQLAARLGVGERTLSRKFSAFAGMTPNMWIRHFRLTRAKKLLENKTGTVAEIAFSVGFENPSYFSKSFKEAFGKSPSEV